MPPSPLPRNEAHPSGKKSWSRTWFHLPFVPVPNAQFPKTSWTLIDRARELTPQGKRALDALCRAYRAPVVAYIGRRRGLQVAEDAEDLTQAFFSDLLRRHDVAKVDPTRGTKFRSWLLACVNNFLKNDRKKKAKKKEIPQKALQPLIEPGTEAVSPMKVPPLKMSNKRTAEYEYMRQFALALVERVREQLRAECADEKEQQLFEVLWLHITDDGEHVPYEKLAQLTGKKEGALRTRRTRLFQAYKKVFRDEVARLVDAPADDIAVDNEVRELLLAMAEPE